MHFPGADQLLLDFEGQEDVGSIVMHTLVQVAVSELQFSQVLGCTGTFSRMLQLTCGVGHCSERMGPRRSCLLLTSCHLEAGNKFYGPGFIEHRR